MGMQNFLDLIKSHGTARPNQFQIYFDFKTLQAKLASPISETKRQNPLDEFYKLSSYYVESTYMPQHNLSTATNILDYAHFEMPYGVSFEPIQINFYMDESYHIREFFYAWADYIYKKDGSKGVSFYEDYTVDIYLKSLNRNFEYNEDYKNSYYVTKLVNAFPKTIGQLMYSQSSRDEILMLPVTFVYERKEEVRISGSGSVALNSEKNIIRARVPPPKSQFNTNYGAATTATQSIIVKPFQVVTDGTTTSYKVGSEVLDMSKPLSTSQKQSFFEYLRNQISVYGHNWRDFVPQDLFEKYIAENGNIPQTLDPVTYDFVFQPAPVAKPKSAAQQKTESVTQLKRKITCKNMSGITTQMITSHPNYKKYYDEEMARWSGDDKNNPDIIRDAKDVAALKAKYDICREIQGN